MTDRPNRQVTVAVMSGPEDGRRYRFALQDGAGSVDVQGNWVLTMGRREDCDLCLPFDTQVSREHARLICKDDGTWLLEDAGSRNGTYIGKRKVETSAGLEPGVLFRIGQTWLRLEETE